MNDCSEPPPPGVMLAAHNATMSRAQAQHQAEVARFKAALSEAREMGSQLERANELLRTEKRTLAAQLADATGTAQPLAQGREAGYLQYIETLKNGTGLSTMQAKARALSNALIAQRDWLAGREALCSPWRRFVLRALRINLFGDCARQAAKINLILIRNPVEPR